MAIAEIVVFINVIIGVIFGYMAICAVRENAFIDICDVFPNHLISSVS